MATASGGVQTTTTMPPAYQLPYLQEGLGLARGLFAEGGPQQYQGNTVVPFSPQTENALAAITQRATTGSPVTRAAGNFLTSTLGAAPSSAFGAGANPYASTVGAGNAPNPYAAAVSTGSGQNPYATTVPTGGAQNPYAGPIATGGAHNPYASPVSGGSAQNPYANAPNPFGGATNPHLDAAFKRAADQSYNTVTSQFARSGRNVGAAMPVQADILTSLAAQIYAPAYEAERNRELQYQSQLTGIGASSFENQQAREMQARLAGQQIGAQGFENAQARALQAGLAGQQIGAQGFENAQSRGLQAALAGQQIGAQGYENAQSRALQAGLAGQQIGAQSFENQQARALQAGLAGQQIGAQSWDSERNRMLQDLTAQRQLQAGLVPYASPIAEQDYRDLAALQGVGQTIEGKSGEIIADNVARWNYDQQRPGAALDDYLRRVSGNLGTTSTTQLPDVYRNPAAGAAGGALMGYQMGGVPGLIAGGLLGYYGG